MEGPPPKKQNLPLIICKISLKKGNFCPNFLILPRPPLRISQNIQPWTDSLHVDLCNCNTIMFLPSQRGECFMLFSWLCSTEISQLIPLSYIQLRYVHTLTTYTLHTGGAKIFGREKQFIVHTSSNLLTIIFFEKIKNC